MKFEGEELQGSIGWYHTQGRCWHVYYCSTLLKVTRLLFYVPNVLCTALQVAIKVPMYYAQSCKKLYSDIVMQTIILLLVLKVRALHKGPGL